MILENLSLDGKIIGRINGQRWEVFFDDPDDYDEYRSVAAVATQFESVLNNLARSQHETRQARASNFGRNISPSEDHWHSTRRAFYVKMNDLLAEGISLDGDISVDAVNLKSWKVRFPVDVFEIYDGVSICHQVTTAIEDLQRDHNEQVHELKSAIFERVGPIVKPNMRRR